MAAIKSGKKIKKRKKPRKILWKKDKGLRDAAKEFFGMVLMMQEDEKRRLSRDLHDETGQAVIALDASLNMLQKIILEGQIEKALAAIHENRQLIRDIAKSMKSMALNLRPPALDILGLSAVLREYFSQCTTSSNLLIEFNENLKDTKLPENVEISLYRIIQEATNNVIKHAVAHRLQINIVASKERLKIIIADNGKGFDLKEFNKQVGTAQMGLRGIRERVDILNGKFGIESVIGEGTRLSIVIKLEESIYGD